MSEPYGPGWQPPQPQAHEPHDPQAPTGWQPAPPQPAGWASEQAPTGWQPPGASGWQSTAPSQPGQSDWQHPTPAQPGPAGWQPPQAPQSPTTQPVSIPAGSAPTSGGGKKSRTPLILTVVAVVVALVAGAGIWWFAIRDTSSTAQGKATPEAAASSLLNALTAKDAVGVAAQLDPAEAALFSDMSGDILTELKRLGIITSDADPKALSGAVITTKDLTYDTKAEEAVNDRVTIVKLTGGTVTIDFDASKLPLTDKVKGAVPDFEKEIQSQNKTIDIAAEVAKNDGKPFRIATVKRGDTWYPSLFYTVADNAYQEAKAKNPSLPEPADTGSITPIGGESPEAAVNGLIDQALDGNLEGIIGMLPPDEMSVLYDYGRSLLEPALKGDLKPVDGVTLSDVAWQVDDVTGGKKVSLKSISITKGGETLKIVRDPVANSITVTPPNQPTVVISPDNLETYIAQISNGSKIDPQLVDIIKREFVQVIGLGFTTVQVDGKWYVSPLRTYSGVLVSLLKGLEPADIDYFISLAHK